MAGWCTISFDSTSHSLRLGHLVFELQGSLGKAKSTSASFLHWPIQTSWGGYARRWGAVCTFPQWTLSGRSVDAQWTLQWTLSGRSVFTRFSALAMKNKKRFFLIFHHERRKPRKS